MVPEHGRSPRLAFGVPIGTLGGLIGLGGAEFRLPVLTGVLGYRARQAAGGELIIPRLVASHTVERPQ